MLELINAEFCVLNQVSEDSLNLIIPFTFVPAHIKLLLSISKHETLNAGKLEFAGLKSTHWVWIVLKKV